jgi:hypothetical protein
MPVVSGLVVLVMLVSGLLFFAMRKLFGQNGQENSSKIFMTNFAQFKLIIYLCKFKQYVILS